ncbi:hypothetical protein HA402_006807 [Bradysia odoriphaga]|nr:hypothetical protein HA402_006807 [Bradysia odoriphaga]
MSQILLNVNREHASEDVKWYALYAYYFLGLSKIQVANMYSKSISTITNWIVKYEDSGSVTRLAGARMPSKFDEEKIQWILDLYRENPILYLDEAKLQFQTRFAMSISTSHVFHILHENNLSWKTLEERAIQIKDSEILKFMAELDSIEWDYSNLVFLDEVSIDNQGLLRTNDYGIIGERLMYRGEFTRKPRISMLAFLGQNGILDVYSTEGTFNRLKFFANCKEFALSGSCEKYPGRNSVWILDGAKIHCHPSIVRYFRSLGILPIFLPAYCPFFNPIEYVFGIMKEHLKRKCGGNKIDMELLVNAEFTQMRDFGCTKLFKQCGYVMSGKFDPTIACQQSGKELGFK